MITDEQLDLIEEYAANFMDWKQIAILLNIDADDFANIMYNVNSPARKRYEIGKVKTTLALSKKMVNLALLGSPQAELLVRDLMSKQENAENEI